MCEENYPKKEFYISLYDYDSDELAIKWDPRDNTPYEKYSKKNCILFRFIQNTDIIKEETKELTDVQKFMFIRRTLNLGNNKEIFEDVRKVYDAIEELKKLGVKKIKMLIDNSFKDIDINMLGKTVIL